MAIGDEGNISISVEPDPTGFALRLTKFLKTVKAEVAVTPTLNANSLQAFA